MPGLTADVSSWFAAHHGVASVATLLDLGLSRHEVDHLVDTGALRRPVRGVVVLAGAPPTEEQQLALACALAPDGVVSHTSAGRLWLLRALAHDRRVHVLVPAHTSPIVPGAVLHRCTEIDLTSDVVVRDDGIVVTSPPRTAFDLAAVLNDERLESVVEHLLDRRLCTMPTLLAVGRRLAVPGRRGASRFIRVVDGRPAWLKPVGSDLELRFERALVRRGVPRPERQVTVTLPNGQRVRLDFLWPEHGEAVEVDHQAWHGGRLNIDRDKQRDRRLRTIGINTTRITDLAINHDLDGAVEDVIAILSRSHHGRPTSPSGPSS